MVLSCKDWNRREWLFFGTGAVALVALGVVTFRSGWLTSGSTDAGVHGIPEYPVEYQASSADFDLRPTQDGLDAVLSALRPEFTRQLRDLGVRGVAAASLESILIDRVEMQLSPDFDSWRLLVGAAAPPQADPAHPDHKDFRRVWDTSAALFHDSPIDIDSIVVRRTESGAEPNLETPGTIFLRSGGPGKHAGSYSDPAKGDQNVEVIETLIPMQYQLPEGEPLPVTVSFRFYRSKDELEWSPTDLYLYFDQRAFGKHLRFPIN